MLNHLRALAFSLCFSLAACSAPSALAPARSGDLNALRSALLQDAQMGRLTRSSLVRIASALASHEIDSTKGPEAISRIAQARLCARHLTDSLQSRAEQSDDAGADAAMALLLADPDSESDDADTWRSSADSSSPSWRAVGARTLFRESDGELRRKLMQDLDENVRLAAVRASELAADVSDFPLLLEMGKHDPNNLVRVAALRAAAAFPSEAFVLELRDLWTHASEPLRQTIVAVWSFPGVLEAGGQRELITVAETTDGAPAIIAGGILYRLGQGTKGAGLAALVRGAKSGPARNVVLAMTMGPLDDPSVLAAILEQAKNPDPTVKVAALSRIARLPSHKDDALNQLRSLAASNLPGADQAKGAVARLGDRSVTALLVADSSSPSVEKRLATMNSFTDLEDWGRVGLFLADSEAQVRMRAACQILNASEKW